MSGDPFPIILFAIGVGSTALIIHYGWRRWWVPVITFAIGFTPLISNIAGHSLVPLLGCEIHEWYADCSEGLIDIGWLLSLMVAAGLLFTLTWPFAAASIVLFAAALVRTVRRRLAR